MYLRMHPLFVEVSLEDLDKASDLLHLGFFQPGRCVLAPEAISSRECTSCAGSMQGGGGANTMLQQWCLPRVVSCVDRAWARGRKHDLDERRCG